MEAHLYCFPQSNDAFGVLIWTPPHQRQSTGEFDRINKKRHRRASIVHSNVQQMWQTDAGQHSRTPHLPHWRPLTHSIVNFIHYYLYTWIKVYQSSQWINIAGFFVESRCVIIIIIRHIINHYIILRNIQSMWRLLPAVVSLLPLLSNYVVCVCVCVCVFFFHSSEPVQCKLFHLQFVFKLFFLLSHF